MIRPGPQPVVPGVPGGRRAEHAGLVGAVELQDRHPVRSSNFPGRLGVGQRLAAGEHHTRRLLRS